MSKGNPIAAPAYAPKSGEIFKHYKGDLYKIVGMAINSGASGDGADEWLVVYEPMYEQAAAPLFARPLVEWQQSVEQEGVQVPRFSKV